MSPVEITANSVLPAMRQEVSFDTEDGERLYGEIALPTWCSPVACIVCIHPLTTHGGSMESHLLRKMSWRLPALAGVAVLRFNLRGAGAGESRSSGAFDNGLRERFDVAAALLYAQRQLLASIWLVGWSFGTDMALMYGNREPVVGAILLSPPLRYATEAHLTSWSSRQRPMTVVVPEFDDYLRPAAAIERFRTVAQADVIGVPGARHLWVGERYVRVVLNEVVKVVAPPAYPLPTQWDGPMQRWSDL